MKNNKPYDFAFVLNEKLKVNQYEMDSFTLVYLIKVSAIGDNNAMMMMSRSS